MSDPTKDTFRAMLLEARLGEVKEVQVTVDDLDVKIQQAGARWSEDEFREAVAVVLADAMREAGNGDREALIRAIAPNILSTVRNEIGHSHPEIIEALSPRMGELIRVAVAKAIEGLQRQIDEAVPIDLWMASVRGALTGTPSSGWLIRDENGFRVIEAFLIERGSGLILAQDRPEGGDDDDVATLDDDLLGGMIAALDSFALDAFGRDGIDELRQLTLSAGTIYLRASPTKILALRCTGVASAETEDEIDRLLERVIYRLQEEGDDGVPARLLTVDAGFAEDASQSAGALVGKGLALAATVMLAIWSHFALEGMNRERWTESVLRTATMDPAMIGYPVEAHHADGTITLIGLVPDGETRAMIESRLAALPLPVGVTLAMPEAGKRLRP